MGLKAQILQNPSSDQNPHSLMNAYLETDKGSEGIQELLNKPDLNLFIRHSKFPHALLLFLYIDNPDFWNKILKKDFIDKFKVFHSECESINSLIY